MAKKIIKSSEKFTRRHAVNLSVAYSLQEVAGSTLNDIVAAAVVEDVDRDTGEAKPVSVLVAGNGGVYTSISSVVMESMDDIIDLLDDGEKFDIQIVIRKTKSSNRDYLSLMII